MLPFVFKTSVYFLYKVILLFVVFCSCFTVFATQWQPSEAAELSSCCCVVVGLSGSVSVTFVCCVIMAKDMAIVAVDANRKQYPFSMTLSDYVSYISRFQWQALSVTAELLAGVVYVFLRAPVTSGFPTCCPI